MVIYSRKMLDSWEDRIYGYKVQINQQAPYTQQKYAVYKNMYMYMHVNNKGRY